MKVLIVADVPGWAYERRALALQKYAPEDISVDVCYIAGGMPAYARMDYNEYDLIFNLDYSSVFHVEHRLKKSGCLKPFVVSYNRDSKSNRWKDMGAFLKANRNGFVIINNLDRFETLNRPERTCNISNGVDLEQWYSFLPVEQRPVHALWCGSSGRNKGKGWNEVLRPLETMLDDKGLKSSFRPFHDNTPLKDWAFPPDQQRQWYNCGAVYVSASESEGTPNTILEAMASGCVPVCTNVGNIREMGVDRENCVIVDRNPESFMEGILYALTNMKRMSKAAQETMWGWSYGSPGNRAQVYFDLFRRIVEDGVNSVKPFSYMD
jgi:glycosyltransferase involved in cell wall biosynthesis